MFMENPQNKFNKKEHIKLITNNAIYFEGLLKAHLAVKNASINILD
jgi:hypothetical protein